MAVDEVRIVLDILQETLLLGKELPDVGQIMLDSVVVRSLI